MTRLVLLAAALLVAIGTMAAATPPAHDWEIGPVIRGKNYSQGLPPHPTPLAKGWYFDFPVGSAAAGHVHYVTFRPGRALGKTRLVVRYRIDAAPGTRFVPQQFPDQRATISLYFQRRGDNWSAKGQFQYYRWYAPPASIRELTPGDYEISVRLDDPRWGSVLSGQADANPEAFADAWRNVERVGLLFGSTGGRGHGVYATAPARFTLLSFDIR